MIVSMRVGNSLHCHWSKPGAGITQPI